MEKPHTPVIYVISDSLGETAEFVARAAASQFNSGHMEIRRVPYVADEQLLEEIVEEASGYNSILAYTLVIPGLKERLEELARVQGIPVVDIMSPMLEAIKKITPLEPRLEPGLLRKMDDEYFRKVEAIEFAVKYDDGKDSRGLSYADIVLVGVSRTSKTPVCMYLAHKRIKAANVPLVPEVAPPAELFRLPPHTIVGLTISPQPLNGIRQERLKIFGLTANADYANKERILKELDYASDVMKRLGCPVIDVTNRAVEEVASEVIDILKKGGAKAPW